MTNANLEAIKEQRKAEAKELGIFLPVKTCPLKNGIGWDDKDDNFCHEDCAWARTTGSYHCVIFGLQSEGNW